MPHRYGQTGELPIQGVGHHPVRRDSWWGWGAKRDLRRSEQEKGEETGESAVQPLVRGRSFSYHPCVNPQ